MSCQKHVSLNRSKCIASRYARVLNLESCCAKSRAQLSSLVRFGVQEARDHEERLKNQMHARWVQALEEVEMLKAAMIYGHFLFETLMKGPLQADFNTHAQEQTPALEDEDLYV